MINNNSITYFIGKCPHCSGEFEVNIKQFNCRIFRHGIYKNNGRQINPHLSKNKCDELFQQNLIWGCGKPFRINQQREVKICDYI